MNAKKVLAQNGILKTTNMFTKMNFVSAVKSVERSLNRIIFYTITGEDVKRH